MTVEADSDKLLIHLDKIGVHGANQVTRGWNHIGATLTDAALQRRRDYEKIVRPRVKELMAAWPDADTTSRFRDRLNSGSLAEVIRWRKPLRLDQIQHMTSVLELHGIETVDEFRAALSDDRRDQLRSDFDDVENVGPKTLDYLDILTGISDSVAVDSRITAITRAAGIPSTSYSYIRQVIHTAAKQRGWRVGDLDAALWAAAPAQPMT